jgi:hypothetical protein
MLHRLYKLAFLQCTLSTKMTRAEITIYLICDAVHLRCDRRGDCGRTGLVGRNIEEEKKVNPV